MMLTEQELRAGLHALTDPVRSAADPVTGVRDRVRALRRRRARATVALSVAVVTLVVVAGYVPMRPHQPNPAPRDTATPVSLPPAKAPDLAHLHSAQDTWPDAVHRLPSRLPDGRDYTVTGVLGDGRYLIDISAGFDLLGDRAILDTRHGNALTVLSAESAGRGDSQYQPQQSVLTADGVAWVAHAQRDGQWRTEVWASSLTARSATLVATLPGRAVARTLAWVVGDRVLFAGLTDGRPGPMYWVPRSGGSPPKQIPGSEGQWPVTAGWTSSKDPLAPAVVGTARQYDESLFNVLSGARVPIRPNPSFQTSASGGTVLTALTCAPSWCLGPTTGPDGGRRVGVQHPDGTGFAEAGPAQPTTVFGGGRFVVGYIEVGSARVQDFIWDVVTGTAGTFGSPVTVTDHVMHTVFDPGQNCYTWQTPDGKLVLDGTAFR